MKERQLKRLTRQCRRLRYCNTLQYHHGRRIPGAIQEVADDVIEDFAVGVFECALFLDGGGEVV
jgi:hypothetical protein